MSRVKTSSQFSRNHIFNACVALALLVELTGCGGFRNKPAPAPAYGAASANANAQTAAAVTSPANTNQSQLLLSTTSVGRVASVNVTAKFVVLQFPLGQVPPVDTRMVVYHGDAKTAEVKITGPAQDDLTVADILLGTVQENDQVRGN